MMVGKNEVIIHDTKEHDINQTMSIYIKPFDIHIMKKDFISNVYEGYIDKNNKVVFAEGEFECDVTQLIPNSTLDEDGYLVDAKGVVYDLTDAPVKVEVGLKDIDISDNEEEGNVVGQIVSIIYKGDHYQVIVRTKDYDDFVVDTEYLWNEFDTVSIAILPENIKMTLKQEAKNYVKD